jgi:hypothetical protein
VDVLQTRRYVTRASTIDTQPTNTDPSVADPACATLCTGDASVLAAWDLVRTSDDAVVDTVYNLPSAKRRARFVWEKFAKTTPEVVLLDGKFDTAKYRVVARRQPVEGGCHWRWGLVRTSDDDPTYPSCPAVSYQPSVALCVCVCAAKVVIPHPDGDGSMIRPCNLSGE